MFKNATDGIVAGAGVAGAGVAGAGVAGAGVAGANGQTVGRVMTPTNTTEQPLWEWAKANGFGEHPGPSGEASSAREVVGWQNDVREAFVKQAIE